MTIKYDKNIDLAEEVFFGVLLWLGFWFKFTCTISFTDGVFREGIGEFNYTNNSFDDVLLISQIGALSLIFSSFLREKFIFKYPKKIFLNTKNESQFFLKQRYLIWSIFLIFFSYKMMFLKSNEKNINKNYIILKKVTNSFFWGLTTSLINPKILIFFTSVFSQFINNDFNDYNKVGIGLLAGIIDTVWYILVSYSVNLPKLKNYIILNQKIIFLFFGFILIIFSIYLVSMSIEYFI